MLETARKSNFGKIWRNVNFTVFRCVLGTQISTIDSVLCFNENLSETSRYNLRCLGSPRPQFQATEITFFVIGFLEFSEKLGSKWINERQVLNIFLNQEPHSQIALSIQGLGVVNFSDPVKRSIVDVWLGSKYASGQCFAIVGLPSNLIRMLEISIVLSYDVWCFREIIRTVWVSRYQMIQNSLHALYFMFSLLQTGFPDQARVKMIVLVNFF